MIQTRTIIQTAVQRHLNKTK